jgi:hypothetical protein
MTTASFGDIDVAWEDPADDGTARSVVEVVADELGPSLRWATATTTKTTRSQAQ